MSSTAAGDAPIHWYFEDLAPGASVSLGSRAVTAGEIVAFARDFDPQPFHLDEDAARRSHFGGLVASGWHTASVTMRLLVDALLSQSSSLGSPGVENLRWLRPVRPDDILSARATVLDARLSESRPDRGIVRVHVETANQRGENVMVMDAAILFARRAKRNVVL